MDTVPSHGSYPGTKLYEIEQRVIALEKAVKLLMQANGAKVDE